MPESLEKKFPDGLVMKIIRDESFSVSNALGGDFQKAYYLCTATWDLKNILGHKPSAEEIVAEYKKCANETDYIFYKNELDQLGITPNELTPAHIIQLQSLLEVQSVTNAYQKRQEELAAFFADNLPHLVLKSKFSTRKTKDGKIKGFEVQPRIVDHIETSNDLSLWFFKKKCELGEFTNKQVLQIMKELQTLCTKYEQLVEEQEKVLDLSFG
ncbi:hypothetical protein KJ632_01560, partial [Patescibacteria group bacterium]|nr:hypothetical protein [Patescibacteria group bacterium]